ncbi:Cobalt-zinc-cadmium resistance protein CzcC precursor [Novipirellula aureliae]|uniref:Cobalt-zinc-cadmium resistance protein CzcC n=1 Tax=Novipirellula aureliae TaxID=2527966 RepID=A0A5C6ED51_9BACT|nr:TolC family protein [Novipirellula aureliae]TWU45486.1 Cobalt-zinc-cadmium resistance protein CzcC precursor [Novipirellula aureliae]
MSSFRLQHTGVLLCYSVAVVLSGCASVSALPGMVGLSSDTEPTESIAATGPPTPENDAVGDDAVDLVPQAKPIELVAYDEALLVDTNLETLATETAEVVTSEPLFASEPMFASEPLFASEEGSMSLSDFEALALGNNPTIQELVATTQKAAGYRQQVGLKANPVIGYQAVQLADQGTDQHVVFISQTIVTAGKLALNRRVLNETLRAQRQQLEAQKYRVVTDIRMKYFDALAAQKQASEIREFLSVVEKGLELAELRKEALEGSQLDVLQAKVQKNEIELALQQAEVRFQAAWRELAAIAGNPQMPPVELSGDLPESLLEIDWSDLASTIVFSSPEYQAAQTRICQARANLDRQCVQAIPNIDFQLASGVDNGTGSGLINFEAGIPIPIHNRNQGNIAAARAELTQVSLAATRIENSIRARIGAVSRDYDSSLAAVTKYADEILPNAAESMRLAETAYKAGETNFLQVLVARRTYFDTMIEYIASQSQLAQAAAMVDGCMLSGALEPIVDDSGDSGLRDLTFSQQ